MTKKYFELLQKIIKNGYFQVNKKGSILYLLNETISVTEPEILEFINSYPIPIEKLATELDLFLSGENYVAKYNAKNILWWNYVAPTFINSYPKYYKKLRLLITEINKEKSCSKQYVSFIGNNNPSNQMPCISLIQFQINNNELTTTVYQRSSDANLGLPNDIYQIYLISNMIDVPLRSITFFIGNIHIYENNYELTKELLITEVKPTFKLNT